ncbi:MAG TPA: hypothetical protein DEG13_14790, partial [Candidatus Microthrix parvicella]|nr:hypothetical protein [Candidatus Microthrix parvicella]
PAGRVRGTCAIWGDASILSGLPARRRADADIGLSTGTPTPTPTPTLGASGIGCLYGLRPTGGSASAGTPSGGGRLRLRSVAHAGAATGDQNCGQSDDCPAFADPTHARALQVSRAELAKTR